MHSQREAARPAANLRFIDATAVVVGVVIGVGIFRAPALVAGAVETPGGFLGLWLLGGALSLCGALCYAELVTAFPSAGGEYHVLGRAFGRGVASAFAWTRLTIIGTGSIALLAFVFGDHVTRIVPLGAHGSALAGALLVVGLTALNVLGLRFGSLIQRLATAVVVVGLLAIAAGALLFAPAAPSPAPAAVAAPTSSVGVAMLFVLLTYGGWNEAAYLSAEMRGGGRRIAWALLAGLAAITAIYVLINAAYVHVLGLEGVRRADTAAVDLIDTAAPGSGAWVVSGLIAVAALVSMNATILTVARTAYAVAEDAVILRPLARWDERAGAPVRAALALGALALGLVALGALARSGFVAMVEVTAPVFWAFLLLTGVALFVLRGREPNVTRPFRVPLYPLVPLVYCATCAWLLYASLADTRLGAFAGVLVVVVAGVPRWIEHGIRKSRTQEAEDAIPPIRPDLARDARRCGVRM